MPGSLEPGPIIGPLGPILPRCAIGLSGPIEPGPAGAPGPPGPPGTHHWRHGSRRCIVRNAGNRAAMNAARVRCHQLVGGRPNIDTGGEFKVQLSMLANHVPRTAFSWFWPVTPTSLLSNCTRNEFATSQHEADLSTPHENGRHFRKSVNVRSGPGWPEANELFWSVWLFRRALIY